MGRYTNKIALIGGGLGRIKKDKFTMGLSGLVAQTFIDEGAKVILIDIDDAVATRCATELGENAEAFACDLLKERTYETEEFTNSQGKKKLNIIWKDNPALDVVTKIVAKYEKIDIVITNFDEIAVGRAEKMDDEIYEKLKTQNLVPVFHILAGIREYMSHKTKSTGEYSRVVMITSFVGKAGMSIGSLYSAFKGSVVSLTKCMAKEFSRFSTVNAVAVGPFANRKTQGPKDRLKSKYLGVSTEYSRKDLTYEKVVPTIAFLASDDAQAINGQIISVDGGLWMKLEQ